MTDIPIDKSLCALPIVDSYEQLVAQFSWSIPERFNIAHAVCDRWADDPHREAITHEYADGSTISYSFSQIQAFSNQLANLLESLSVIRGDSALICLAQSPACAIAHTACFKSGVVSCLASVLFGPDGLRHRLVGSNAKVCIIDSSCYANLAAIRDQCPQLEHVIVVGSAELDQTLEFWSSLEKHPASWNNVDTHSEDAAWINYTSGTTGMPKGAVMPHRTLLGNVPQFQYFYDYFPRPGDVLWSQADWAWVAGFVDILLIGWFHGCKVISTDMKGFDPDQGFRVLADHHVSVSLLTPTMLKLMRQSNGDNARRELNLRVVLSGGEAVGNELAQWADQQFGLTINEGFGQSECNGMIGTNCRLMATRHGSLGKPTPGAVCAIVDDQGEEVAENVHGNIAIKRPHPAMFSHYLDDPEATRQKFTGDWMITGDLGSRDAGGYFWFHGRIDDVITSSGYRIGPTEIEDALLKSEAVKLAAVVGVKDPQRTEIVKAFVVLAEGVTPSERLTLSLQNMVRENLAKHEVPREIEYVDSLPMTPTGKILRRELRTRQQ